MTRSGIVPSLSAWRGWRKPLDRSEPPRACGEPERHLNSGALLSFFISCSPHARGWTAAPGSACSLRRKVLRPSNRKDAVLLQRMSPNGAKRQTSALHLKIGRPVIRRGRSGHFCDKALDGVSHHAIVPNVNVMDDLEVRIAGLSDDEKRLFALICRSYLAAVMPDFEYRQTVVTMKVPLPQQGSGAAADFRAVGRIPLVQGWKAAFGVAEPEPGREKEEESETEQALPQLVDGQSATLTDPRVQAKQTQPP